jgi:hypothetical protein
MQLKKAGQILSSRNRAHALFDTIPDGGEMCLDFKDVEQASPSFLHETLVILNQKTIKLVAMNASESIAFQLRKAQDALGVTI